MSLTLLIDLDDTLLSNPLDRFMPSYLKLLSEHLSPVVSPKDMVPQLLKATDKMVAKDDPASTLESTFDEDFYDPLGIRKVDLKDRIDQFYREDFLKLQAGTSPRPEAIKVIRYAVQNKYTIVVATNPLFPLQAMTSRLNWAGLSPAEFPFRLITSYESMHFAKPNPAYYAEILGIIGWPIQPVCMIGNSLKDDILPASEIGITCFYLNDINGELPGTFTQGSVSGGLESIIPWLNNLENNPIRAESKRIPAILPILKSTPAVLETFTNPLSEKDWKERPIHGEWSILEIVSHLQDVEKEIFLPRFQRMIDETNPFLEGVDSDLWTSERKYNETRSPGELTEFFHARKSLVDFLSSLHLIDWQRKANHSIFGSTTLQEMASFIASHDQDHIRQILKTLNFLK
jgi:FMN phosphatase YigB (HAD superfamily)